MCSHKDSLIITFGLGDHCIVSRDEVKDTIGKLKCHTGVQRQTCSCCRSKLAPAVLRCTWACERRLPAANAASELERGAWTMLHPKASNTNIQ